MSFKDKVVVVTGAGSGIGAATAIEFSKEGANVVIVDKNKQRADDTSKQCKDSLAIYADVSNDDDVRRIIDEAIKKYKQIDVLVNNAGIGPTASIFDSNVLKCYDDLMRVNLRAAVHLTSLAAPHLVKTKGNIVNISSVAAQVSSLSPELAMYAVSKAALTTFTVLTASELASFGVRVNAISPGPVKTNLVKDNNIPTSDEILQKATALNRLSEPVEIAALVLHLASDKAKAITGSNIVTDNGYALRNN